MKETFKYKGFEGSMEFSAEDECLAGEVLFVHSKIIYTGETFAELKQAFEDAVDAYLLHCAKHNIEPEKPCSGTFNIRIGSELHKEVIKYAYEHEMSLNEVMIKAASCLVLDEVHHTHTITIEQSTNTSFTTTFKNNTTEIGGGNVKFC